MSVPSTKANRDWLSLKRRPLTAIVTLSSVELVVSYFCDGVSLPATATDPAERATADIQFVEHNGVFIWAKGARENLLSEEQVNSIAEIIEERL